MRPDPPRTTKNRQSVRTRPCEAGFDEFWTAYPTLHNRRAAKPKCLQAWVKKRCAEEVPAILAHLDAMKRTRDWQEGFEPASLTYLNGELWRDGMPAVGKPAAAPAERRVAL